MTVPLREPADQPLRDADGAGPPVAVLAMSPEFVPLLFDEAAVERLSTLARVDLNTVLRGSARDWSHPSLLETEVLLTCWGAPRLDASALAALPRLRTVIHAAGTVKAMVTDECRRRGIRVSSGAAANALPVAEHTVAMILLANKRTLWMARRYRELRSAWRSSEIPRDIGNYHKTVGIVGASRIGRRVIELLRPFDLYVLLSDPYVDAQEARRLGVELVDLDALCERSDVVSLHAPALPGTKAMMNGPRLAAMRDGATLINTARGMLIDNTALMRELRTGRINAVLDTADPEILHDESPLYELPNVVLTPHIAGSLGNELRRMGRSALDELARYASGEPFAFEVRYADLERSA